MVLSGLAYKPKVEERTESSDDENDGRRLHLKGQMMFMADWENIIFLGTPM